MATKYLNAVLGAEQNLRPRVHREISELYKQLSVAELFVGRISTYEPLDEVNGEQLPDDYQRVQLTAVEVWGRVRELLVELFDVTAARDFTNGDGVDAVADIVVGGNVLVADAPAPYLIWLDRQLDNVKNMVDRMPTLPATSEWTIDDSVRGVYISAEARTRREIQQWKSIVTLQPTDRHPGQTHVYQEASGVGWWTKRLYSGAMQVEDKAQLMQRVLTLQNAVDSARQAANRVEAKDPKPGSKLVSYVFDTPVGN